jgi:hypothetical protein
MPRRELLTPDERETLLSIPNEEFERIRHYTLSRADINFIRQHRWTHNRLDVAVQLCVLRYPGRVLNRAEQPPAPLLGMIGAQLIAPALWERYAARDQTRRQHQLELVRRLGLTLLSRELIRELVTWLLPLAAQTTQGTALLRAVNVVLRMRKIVLPRISTRRPAMPPTRSMDCCITSPSFASRSTTPTPPVSPTTCSRSASYSASASPRAFGMWPINACMFLGSHPNGRCSSL